MENKLVRNTRQTPFFAKWLMCIFSSTYHKSQYFQVCLLIRTQILKINFFSIDFLLLLLLQPQGNRCFKDKNKPRQRRLVEHGSRKQLQNKQKQRSPECQCPCSQGQSLPQCSPPTAVSDQGRREHSWPWKRGRLKLSTELGTVHRLGDVAATVSRVFSVRYSRSC